MSHGIKSRTKRALITGVTGQDGSYLAELLLSKGYEVHGINAAQQFQYQPGGPLVADWHERDAQFYLHFADLSDATSLAKLVYRLAPDEIYHLGAQSHVRVSFDIPEYTGDITALGRRGYWTRFVRRNSCALLYRGEQRDVRTTAGVAK